MNSNHTPATLLADDGPPTSSSAKLLPSVPPPLLSSVPPQPDAAPLPPAPLPPPAPALPATPKPLPETLTVLSSPSNSVHSFCSGDTQVIPALTLKTCGYPKRSLLFHGDLQWEI